jgi:hypothetical protein
MVVIDGYTIDVAVTIDASIVNDVTEHPVEDGADVADHVRAKPIRLVIEGVVSDTPIGEIVSERDGDALPSQEAYSRLIEMSRAREPVTIETDDRGTFDNMMLATLSAPVNAETGDALRFTATFIQVTLVENSRATVLVAVPLAKKKVNKGAKPTKTGPPPPLHIEAKVKALKESRRGPKSELQKLLGD